MNFESNSKLNPQYKLFQQFLKSLPEFLKLGYDHKVAIGRCAVVVEIILVVIFGRVERPCLGNLSNDRLIPGRGFVEGFHCFFSFKALLLIMVKYGRTVLGTDVSPLPVEGCRVMGLEKHFGSLEIGKTADLVIVEGDPLLDFSVIGKPVSALFMGGELVIDNCSLLT